MRGDKRKVAFASVRDHFDALCEKAKKALADMEEQDKDLMSIMQLDIVMSLNDEMKDLQGEAEVEGVPLALPEELQSILVGND